jgi:NAD(P)-dependent dehydrogenase (short-subunit alcohol dehydrogenase family)
VKGAFFLVQALAPLVNRGASIVISGSISAHIGMPATMIYASIEAALEDAVGGALAAGRARAHRESGPGGDADSPRSSYIARSKGLKR